MPATRSDSLLRFFLSGAKVGDVETCGLLDHRGASEGDKAYLWVSVKKVVCRDRSAGPG